MGRAWRRSRPMLVAMRITRSWWTMRSRGLDGWILSWQMPACGGLDHQVGSSGALD